MDDLRKRERRLRRALARLGYKLKKTPARSYVRRYCAGYQIIDQNDHLLYGDRRREHQATLDELEDLVMIISPSS